MIRVKTSAVYWISAVRGFVVLLAQYKEAHNRSLIVNDFWH